MADEFDPKKFLAETEPAFDPKAFLAQPVKRENTTLMDYPQIYGEMNRESREQMERGVKQLGTPTGGDLGRSVWETAKGVGNIGLGALGYVGSPIAAGIRTVVGEPGEQRFGVPKEYSEFAASLATPGIGLPRIPGSTAPKYATKISGPSTGKLADEARLLTEGGQKTQAGLAMREAATDPAAAQRALGDVEEILPGSRPTTFQASRDYGLGQFERGVQTKAQAPFQERRAEQGVARTNALESTQRPGNPEEVSENLRTLLKTEDAAAEEAERFALARAERQVQQATARAQQADQAAGGTGFAPDISGQVFQRELVEANTSSRNLAKSLWDNIDPQGRLSVNAGPVLNTEFRLRDSMTLADAKTVTQAEKDIQEVISQYGAVVPFKEMQSLRSLVSTAMRDEMRARGPTAAYARLAELRASIEQSVVAPFEAGVAAGPGQAALSVDAAERLAAATAATRERSAIFKAQPVQGIIQPGQGGELRMTPSVVPGKIIPNGPRGYDTVNAYLRATEGRPGGGGLQEVSEALVADMRASATDVNGNIDPNKLMGWAKRKQDALRAVTERDGGALVQRLTDLETAGRDVRVATVDQTRIAKEAAANREAVSKAGNEGIFGDLVGVRDKQDISKLLGSIFGSKTAVADAEMLMARLTTPEAQDGARRAITDWITSKLVSNTAAGTTEVNILRADQFQSFIRDKAAVLERFGFTPEQIKTWQAIAADMRQAKMSIDATKVPGGSNTAQDLYAMKKFGLAGSKLSKILHLSGLVLGGWTSGPLGAIAGLLGAGKYTAFRDASIKSVQDLIVKGMLEPEFGRQLLARVTPKENIAFWRTTGMYGKRAVRAEALTGSRHDQNEQPAIGHKYGGAIFPLSREGIQARNKARAFEARERSSFARQSAEAKRKVKYAEGGFIGEMPPPPRNPNELYEGEYDPTAPGGTRPGVYGRGYQGVKGELLSPGEGAKFPLRNVQPITPGTERLGELDAFERHHGLNPLEQEYYRSFGAPASPGIEEEKPYRIYAEGGAVRRKLDLRTPDTGGAYQADYGGGSFEPSRPQGTLDVQGSRVPEVSGSIPLTDNFSLRGSYQHPSLEDPRRGFSIGGDYTYRFQDGGDVDDDSSGESQDVKGEPDPLEAERQRRNVPGGLNATAGPTVTSTTPVQDIPAPRVNSQGETFPTFAIKGMAQNFSTLPGRAARSSMQAAEGDPDYNPLPIMETAKLVMGSPSVPRGALGAGPAIRTWHASPHDFEKFDISKIGTGQGAASYGKGIYTAESPKVSGVGGEYWKEFAHKDVDQYYPMHRLHERKALEHLIRADGDRKLAIANLQSDISRLPENSAASRMYRDSIDLLESDKRIGPRVYKTEIKAPSGEFLDWDAPLAGQPAVKKMPGMVEAAGEEAYNRAVASTSKGRASQLWDMTSNPEKYATGEMAYQGLLGKTIRQPGGTSRSGAKDVVMQDMREAGIPGVRYLDQVSRDVPRQLEEAKRAVANIVKNGRVGTPEYEMWLKRQVELERTPLTRNYVTNRDDILQIINKYGWAGLAPLGISIEAAREALKDQGFAEGGGVFDPEGADYDMESAKAAGLEPDETGHWSTRDPRTGLVLKGAGHPTFNKSMDADVAAGYVIKPGEGGRYYSQPAETPSYLQAIERMHDARKRGLASGGRVNDDSSKVTKASVNYSKGMPKAHCSICTHWRHGKCTEVQGKIWHSMWCKLFKHARKYADGDLVEPDPLEAELKRRNVPGGLSPTAGPTVTSTTPVQDIPAPKVNSQGETLPTYMLKELAKQPGEIAKRITQESSGLQSRGEYAGSHEDLPSFGPPPEEMPSGLAAASMLYGFNAPFSAVRPGLGIFGGRGAKTANLEKLAEAERMLKEGVPHETIRNRTGWEFGADGKPRFEISDQEARIVKEHPEDRIYEADAASRATGFRPNQRLEQQIEHSAAYEAYPWLKDIPTSLDVHPTAKPSGGYTPPTKQQRLRGSHGEIEVTAPTYDRRGVGDLLEPQKYSDVGARDLLLHEMTHPIQEFEGFAPGSNPRALPVSNAEIRTLTQNMAKREGIDWNTASPRDKEQMERVIRHRIYKMQAGEAEARNVQTRADFGPAERQRPSWKTEDVDRENQVIAKTGRLKPGEKPFKDAKVYKSELPPEPPSPPSKPGILRSEFDRPLFDYSRMEEVPNVQQFDLPRIIPARGIPEHIMRLGDPRNMERTNAIVQMGMAHGGPEWYNTMPLRDRYIGEVGPVRGPESHRSYINYVGATSPRSPVPLNASVASYYDMLAAQGLPFPQPVFRRGNWSMPRGQLPEGYGSLAQATNARNAQMVRDQGPGGGWPSWTFFDKPKPPSFVANLLGNYRPITSDVHNVSMLDLRGPRGNRLIMPPHQYYGYIEGLQQGPKGAGQFIDLAPAQYQASGWIPWAAGYRDVGRYGEVTGGSPKKLQAYSEPFIKVVEDRVKKKARDLGWSPEQTLRAFLRKEIAIAGVPVAAIPLLQSRMGDEAQ